MKRVLLLCTVLTVASCTVVNVHQYPAPPPRVYKRIPPGHEKRRYGDQSARSHAPGHRAWIASATTSAPATPSATSIQGATSGVKARE